jgi:3-dehydroquinate synthetase
MKAEIVGQDEKEQGVRALLNLVIPLATPSKPAWAMAHGCMVRL